MVLEDIAHRCFRCGYCKFDSSYKNFNCPSYRKFEFDTFFSGGRMWLARGWLEDDLDTSKNYGKIFFSCATCGSCEERCPFEFKDSLLDGFEDAKAKLIDEGLIPPSVRDYLESVAKHGNPYEESQSKRGEWAEGTDIQPYSDQEFLLYVGDVASYDESGKEMAKSIGNLLNKVGISFGILGDRETSDGNDVKACGERGLFEDLAEKNIESFEDNGVEKIITISPHAYNAFVQDYPNLEDIEVKHFTQILANLMEEGKIPMSDYDAKATFHDPCYLGRHNKVYDPPREILEGIPGLDFIEMERNRDDAFCCGGGGANVFTDMLESSGKNSPSRIRVREALDTGADILAVACPSCYTMLEDAVKAEGVEEDIKIMDLAEVVLSAID